MGWWIAAGVIGVVVVIFVVIAFAYLVALGKGMSR